MGGEEVKLDVAGDRIAAGQDAGDTYTDALEEIKGDLSDESGSSLGTMVGAQLRMTESETTYQTQSGLPKAATKAVKGAADNVNRAAG
jgi:hypothetical protein